MTNTYDTDLLIVGAGPVGLTASIIASRLNINHLVIEKREGLHTLPQAHVIKTRSMEIFRRLGIESEIHDAGTNPDEQQYTTWRTCMTGSEYGYLDLKHKKGPSTRFLSVSPTYPANLSQNLLEPIIYSKACEQAGDKINFNTELLGLEQDETGVTARIKDRQGNTKSLRARYLIAADGAGSTVRRQLNIAFDGPPMLAQFCTIHLRSDFTSLAAKRPGVLYWILNPDIRGVFIVHNMRKSQVFMVPYDTQKMTAANFDMDKCRDLVEKAIGKPHPFEIIGIDHWTMSAQVARTYRKDRAFLAGDAAHRFPPTGGLGMNTGVQDVNNLVWKLAAAIKGNGSEALLNSYELECRPIAEYNRDRSAHNHHAMTRVQELIGVSPDKSAFQASIDALFSDEGTNRRAKVQSAIDDQIKHFAFMDVEMAPTYKAGAFGASVPRIENDVPIVEGFVPNINPGSPFPHISLDNGRSTLDETSCNTLTLFISNSYGRQWSQAALKQAVPAPFSIKTVEINHAGHEVWQKICDHQDLAVLVRPDGHIGWVGNAQTSTPAFELATGIAKIFCK